LAAEGRASRFRSLQKLGESEEDRTWRKKRKAGGTASRAGILGVGAQTARSKKRGLFDLKIREGKLRLGSSEKGDSAPISQDNPEAQT